jgi:YVTN family beta-propeller protein
MIASLIVLILLTLAVSGGAIPAACAGEATADYLGPCALAASSDGKTLYVACADARQVVWVDLSSGSVTRRSDVPSEPTGLVLTPDGTKLIVTCAAPKSTVAVFDASSGDSIAAIPAGHTAMSPAIGPCGKRVYVCNRFTDDVSVIDLAAGKEVTRVAAVRQPIAAAVTPDGREVLVANHLPSTRTDADFKGEVAPLVTVIDATSFATDAIELRHGANGLRGLCISPDGRHALVTHLLSNFEMTPFRVDTGWINVNVVSIMDIGQRKLVSTIGLDDYYLGAGNPYDVACSADGETVCVSIAGTHELCVISLSDLLGEFAHRTMQPMMAVWPIYLSLGESLWQRNQLPGNGPRGLATAGSKVYIAQYFSDSVAVFDLEAESQACVTTISLGPAPQLTQQRRGEMLFHDATICYQHWQSCASCHPDGRVDGLNWDLMNDGPGTFKNTKSMLLSHRTPPAMAEGVRESAETAVRAGIAHILFADRPEEEAAAIDAYLESLRPASSPYLIDGRFSPAAERGRKLFDSTRVGCGRCHVAPQYTDLKSHYVGEPGPGKRKKALDTPTLVEVWRTAPYLHDGRYTTIHELLAEGKHGLRRAGVELNEQEINDLAEFVLSL